MIININSASKNFHVIFDKFGYHNYFNTLLLIVFFYFFSTLCWIDSFRILSCIFYFVFVFFRHVSYVLFSIFFYFLCVFRHLLISISSILTVFTFFASSENVLYQSEAIFCILSLFFYCHVCVYGTLFTVFFTVPLLFSRSF